MQSDLHKGKELGSIKPDLRTSVIKPIHARWLIKAHATLSSQKDLIFQGFEKAGIKDTINM